MNVSELSEPYVCFFMNMDMDYQIGQWMIVMILIFGNGTISKSQLFIIP